MILNAHDQNIKEWLREDFDPVLYHKLQRYSRCTHHLETMEGEFSKEAIENKIKDLLKGLEQVVEIERSPYKTMAYDMVRSLNPRVMQFGIGVLANYTDFFSPPISMEDQELIDFAN